MINVFRRAAAAAAFVIACGTAAPVVDAATVSTKAGPVNVEPLAKLDNPWGMAYLPDGRLLITEKPGTLRIFADGKLSEPVEGVPAVAYRGQGGLLDVAVDPNFAQNAARLPLLRRAGRAAARRRARLGRPAASARTSRRRTTSSRAAPSPAPASTATSWRT